MRTHILLLFCLFTWLLPATRPLWNMADRAVYYYCHSSVGFSDLFQQIVAFLNSRYGDWIFEVMAIFFLLRRCRLRTVGGIILFIAIVQIVINKWLFFKVMGCTRESPSLVMGTVTDLSRFTYPNNKVGSIHSFPADHATTIFLVLFFVRQYFERREFYLFSIISLCFILPRLITGAHWFTDIFFGGFYIAFVVMALKKFVEKISQPSYSEISET